jgi:hypothetical protein
MPIDEITTVVCLTVALTDCALQTYRPTPVSLAANAASLQSHAVQDDRFRAFPRKKLPLPQRTLPTFSAAEQRAKQQRNDQKPGTGGR